MLRLPTLPTTRVRPGPASRKQHRPFVGCSAVGTSTNGSVQQQPQCAVEVPCSLGRRDVLALGASLALVGARPAEAEPVAEVAPSPASTSLASQPWLDDDFQLVPPDAWTFVDLNPPYDPERRGPAPERSPVRARFDSGDGASVSVVVRNAASLKQSLLQITDVSMFGTITEAAQLLVPRGSKVLAFDVLKVDLPARETALGPVEVPPKQYYRYDIQTNNGLRVFMSVACQKGRVYVCGGSTSAADWPRYGGVLTGSTQSFRLRDGKMLLG